MAKEGEKAAQSREEAKEGRGGVGRRGQDEGGIGRLRNTFVKQMLKGRNSASKSGEGEVTAKGGAFEDGTG